MTEATALVTLPCGSRRVLDARRRLAGALLEAGWAPIGDVDLDAQG